MQLPCHHAKNLQRQYPLPCGECGKLLGCPPPGLRLALALISGWSAAQVPNQGRTSPGRDSAAAQHSPLCWLCAAPTSEAIAFPHAERLEVDHVGGPWFQRRGLSKCAVGAVRVMKIFVLAEQSHQVGQIPDQRAVGKFGTQAPRWIRGVHSVRGTNVSDRPAARGIHARPSSCRDPVAAARLISSGRP